LDRNLNAGEERVRGTRTIKATNVIYNNKARSSAAILAIAP
jgi:hypothetical protein